MFHCSTVLALTMYMYTVVCALVGYILCVIAMSILYTITIFRVPGTPDPSGQTVILDRGAFDKIRHRSRVLSAGDRRLMEETIKATKTQKLDSVNARKSEMQQHEITRKRNEKPSDLEQVRASKVHYTLG